MRHTGCVSSFLGNSYIHTPIPLQGDTFLRFYPVSLIYCSVTQSRCASRGWNGDISGYKSKSEADFTLALLLLYWTNDDLAQTRRLFQQSGLYDPEKTDRLTGEHSYLDVTIYNALKKRSK